MKKIIIFLILILPFQAFSQDANPLEWSKTYFGSTQDHLSDFIQTFEGGYIFIGKSLTTTSQMGIKSVPGYGGFDWWIVKTDANGNKEWDQTFGGTGEDDPVSIVQTTDGGYLITGNSTSGLSGTKSQPNFGATDIWVIKTDGLGNKQWDKTYGGADSESASMALVTNTGILIAGTSNSGVTGNKSVPTKGQSDFWLITTDGSGNILTQTVMGGPKNETLSKIRKTTDGGFILGGTSNSEIGGDKSQQSVSYDFWMVKLDANLNKQWDKSFNEVQWSTTFSDDYLNDIYQTTNGGYILLGNGVWVIKTDGMGNLLWDKSFKGGGRGPNWQSTGTVANNLQQTPDGGFLIAVETDTNVWPDKSSSFIGPHTWIIKIDQNGNKLWDRSLQLGLGYLFKPKICNTTDGNFIIASQGSLQSGTLVQWIMKFGPEQAFLKMPELPFNLCAGDSFSISDYAFNQFSPNNTFKAELHLGGSYVATIGMMEGKTGNPIKVKIPNNISPSKFYHVRLTASNPAISSYYSWHGIAISPKSIAPEIISNSPVMIGEKLFIKSDSLPNTTYSWTGPNGFTSKSASIVIPEATNTYDGIYSLIISKDGCSSEPVSTRVIIDPLPSENVLLQNFPNPFSANTTIPFWLREPGEVEFTVYSPLGQTLIKHKQYFKAGKRSIDWVELTKDKKLGSGTYFYRLTLPNFTANKKLMLVK